MDRTRTASVVVALLVTAAFAGSYARAQEGGDAPAQAENKPKYDLTVWGQLKPLKGHEGFYEFSYVGKVRGRPKKMTAFVKIEDDLKTLVDKTAKPTAFEKGDKVFMLGKVRETTTVSPDGVSLTERHIVNVQAALTGIAIKIDEEFRDRRDPGARWLETEVEANEKRLKVNYQDSVGYSVSYAPRSIVLNRTPGKASDVTGAKKGLFAFILANETEDRPDTGKRSDAKTPAFSTNRVIVLNPQAAKLGIYHKLYP